MAGSEEERSSLLLTEHQSAWENYRHIFGMRFDLLKYLFGVVFAAAAATPVVLSYVQGRGIAVRTNYYVLLLVVVVSGLLALMALFSYGVLVNWNQALRKHSRTITNIRKHVFGSGPEQRLVTISLPADPVEDRLLHPLHSSPPAMESVTIILLVLLLVLNWVAAIWLYSHTNANLSARLAPFLVPLLLTLVTGFALGRRALLAAKATKVTKA